MLRSSRKVSEILARPSPHLDFLDSFSRVDADKKCPYILQIEVRKAVKNIRRDQKTTGYDEVPGNVLRLLGKDGLRLKTQLIKTHIVPVLALI